jgi:dTDP-4-amino-4,6-dideoxygalactose transaminase
MINVTKTYLPDIEKYKNYVDQIYTSGWLTNNGKLVNELQERLSSYLGVKNLLLVANGTLALQVAYKLLQLKGDVLTTPFSFVATTSSLVWEGLNPVFVDIDSDTYNLDPTKLEAKITVNTTAIVATHVYGNPCNVEAIEALARKYGLSVIYDAAHAFGVEYKGSSLLNRGDISTISFHSTKTFHTIEGGALIIHNDQLFEKAKKMINFGIVSPTEILELGINAKMNEFQAAMGLCVLDEMKEILQSRKKRYEYYLEAMNNLDFIRLPKRTKDSSLNYSHFPILFECEETMLKAITELNKQDINPRRYFYPSLNSLPYLKTFQEAPISTDIASRVLCLPLSHELTMESQNKIINIIRKVLITESKREKQ